MLNVDITLNEEKNGIEIRFDGKPEAEVIESLKSNGFRWRGKQKMWFAKQTDERIQFANSLNGGEVVSSVAKNKTEKQAYDLWDMTRTEDIPNNFELHKIYDTKEIAAIVRKHIKPRFPMCKFSVRSDYNSIDVDLLASPFAKDSDELKAIVHYIYVFVESYNYNNSDSMTDYFDVNFYFSSERNIISYRYEQTETTENIEGMVTVFQQKKVEWEQAEAIRREEEFQVRKKQMEIDRQIAAKAAEKEKVDKKAIEDGSVVSDLESPYYILDLRNPHLNKFCTIDEANAEIEKGEFKNEVCQITREAHMSVELYEKFKNLLLLDFSFLSGMGGTGTLDNRIMEMLDYDHMDEDERNTVEFFSCNCVAIYCENELMFVCNPEGYDYARYVLIPGESYTKTNNYTIEQVIPKEMLATNREVSDELYDKSTDIIMLNQLGSEWNGLKFGEWRSEMVNYINESGIAFNVDIVRAIPNDAMDFKIAMYRLLEEPESIRDQFYKAGFVEGQKITVIRFDDVLGGVRAGQVTFKRYEYTDWGGKEGVKLIVTVPHKHGEYYQILNGECLVIDGWVEIPRELFWEETTSKTGLKCAKSRYFSFDKKQYDVTLDYLRSIGAEIMVNTYKPIFNWG